MRWHFLIESEWIYLQSINLPEVDFAKLHKHFQLNLDEGCFLCSDGILKIIGDAYRRHHDKNVADNRVSITTVRIGSAGGSNGPVIYIAVGSKGEQSVSKMYRNRQLEKYMVYRWEVASSVTNLRTWTTQLGCRW